MAARVPTKNAARRRRAGHEGRWEPHRAGRAVLPGWVPAGIALVGIFREWAAVRVRGSAPKKARLQDRTRQLKHEEAKRPQGRATEGSGPAGAAASTTMAAIATTAAPRVDHPANRPKAPAPRHRAPRASRPPQGLPAPRAGRPPRVRPAPRAPQARALLAPRARQPLRAAARQACPAPRTPRHPPRPALAHQHRLAHLPRGS